MRRMNFAPTAPTIIVALLLMLASLLGTYGSLLPDAAGIIAYVLATGILLVGMVFRQI